MAADDERGFFSEHDAIDNALFEVATAKGRDFAAIRPSRRPLACMRFEDFHFEFDSSFVKASAAPELTLLATWHDQLGRPSLGVFGHADPVGDDEYNKTLSGRRAQAVYGLLTRRTALWDELWATPLGGDNWQNLASARAAHAQGFAAYMDTIARDASGAPWKVAPAEFLGEGRDPGGKADYQGCSEFNPVLRFSSADEQALSKPGRKEERNRRNASNRRVLVFLWPPGRKVDPAGWPCPRVKESTSGCRAQFWPDGDARRSPTQTQREYAKDRNTFACRWYDELARESPCEAARKLLQIRLFDAEEKEMPNAEYRLTIGSVEVRERTADALGVLTEPNVLAVQEIKLEWGATTSNGSNDSSAGNGSQTQKVFQFENVIRLDFTRGAGNEPSARRLRNLGYYGVDFESSMSAFRQDYDIPDAADDTKAKEHLADIHDNQLSKDEFKRKNNLS